MNWIESPEANPIEVKSPFTNMLPEPMVALSKQPALVTDPAPVAVLVPTSCQVSEVTVVVCCEDVPVVRVPVVAERSTSFSVKRVVSVTLAVPAPVPQPM